MRRRHSFYRLMRKRKGFSIIEVAISVAVLGSALIACTQLILVAQRAINSDKYRATTLNELERKVELLQETGFDLIQSEPRSLLPGSTCPDSEMEIVVTEVLEHLKKVEVILYRLTDGGSEVKESTQFYVADCSFPTKRTQ